MGGHVEIARSLVQHGADIALPRTDSGGTPLYTAAYNGQPAPNAATLSWGYRCDALYGSRAYIDQRVATLG